MELYGAVLFAELSDAADLATFTVNDGSSGGADAFSTPNGSCDSVTLEFLETGYTEDFISISVLDYDEGETVFLLPELISDIDSSACSDYYLKRSINFYNNLSSNSWYSLNLEDSEIIIYGEDSAVQNLSASKQILASYDA